MHIAWAGERINGHNNLVLETSQMEVNIGFVIKETGSKNVKTTQNWDVERTSITLIIRVVLFIQP